MIKIPTHKREKHNLQEFFCLLTKRCNSNCTFCIEKDIHTGGFLTWSNFKEAVSFRFKQNEWKTKLYLGILATEDEFPTEQYLLDFIKYANKQTGMEVYVNTINPVNQGAYDNQYVSYLEDKFLSLPIEDIFSSYHKAGFYLCDGTRVRMGNKSMNPGHPKYSMDPNGQIHDHFEHSKTASIKHDEKLDLLLTPGKTRLEVLRML